MKKTIMTIGAFAMLTFCQAQNWKANEAVNTLADMEEWMSQDIANGEISEELGQLYIENINEVIRLVLTINEEDACIRDKDLNSEKKKHFTLIKFVINEPVASNDSIK
tara:strand:- start:135 stop:458 length:324 start_codon:yes stop_codon:yes gene_type:complete